MKKIIVLSLILLLMLPLALAGESYDLELQEGKLNGITLAAGDEVRFELLGATHSLYIKDIGRDGDVKISFIPFLDNEKQSYGFLSFGMSLEADLDQDGENDIALGLLKLEEDGRVVIGLQDADARKYTDTAVGDDVTGLVVTEGMKKSYSIVYVIVALLLGIVGLLFVVNRSKKIEELQPDEPTPEEPSPEEPTPEEPSPDEQSEESPDESKVTIVDEDSEEKPSEDESNTEED